MFATDQGHRTSVVSEPIDVRALRYPTEPSRFVLAAVCTLSGLAVVIVWMAQLGLPLLLGTVAALAFLLLVLWVALQINRVRILGDAVLVTSQTFPDFQQAIDEVRDRLDYHRRVDIFVVPKLTTPVQLTSYFGVRVLMVEGGAVADIMVPAKRPQLLFLVGTYFGALKAKHARWAVVEILIEHFGLRKVLAPFVGPWLRATVYTGDQIAYACSRDLETSLDAAFRALVGRELSPQLEAAGLIKQAQRVRESVILRFSQLFRPTPHATNRFLNLLGFAQRVEPEAVATFRAALPEGTTTSLDMALERATRDERRRVGAAVVTCIALAVSSLMVYAGFIAGDTLPDSPNDGDDVVAGPPLVDTPSTPSEPPTTPPPIPTPTEMLIEAVPAPLGASCDEIALPPTEFFDLSAAVKCVGVTAADADVVDVYAFESYDGMSAAMDYWGGDPGAGACVDGLRGPWTDNDDIEVGTLGCYYADTGESVAVWTIDDEGVLIVAADANMGLDELFAWWQQATPTSLLS